MSEKFVSVKMGKEAANAFRLAVQMSKLYGNGASHDAIILEMAAGVVKPFLPKLVEDVKVLGVELDQRIGAIAEDGIIDLEDHLQEQSEKE